MTTQEPKDILLTVDGKGKTAKTQTLNELMCKACESCPLQDIALAHTLPHVYKWSESEFVKRSREGLGHGKENGT